MSKVKAVILSIAIALIATFFFAYAIESIYPSPEYSDFCDQARTVMQVTTEQDCLDNDGTWQTYDKPIADNQTGYCEFYTKCNDAYDQARKPHERNVFIANLIIGIILIIVGIVLALPSVSTGLMGAGVLTLLYGTIRNWNNLSNIPKTIILGAALIILIWIGYKKLKN